MRPCGIGLGIIPCVARAVQVNRIQQERDHHSSIWGGSARDNKLYRSNAVRGRGNVRRDLLVDVTVSPAIVAFARHASACRWHDRFTVEMDNEVRSYFAAVCPIVASGVRVEGIVYAWAHVDGCGKGVLAGRAVEVADPGKRR